MKPLSTLLLLVVLSAPVFSQAPEIPPDPPSEGGGGGTPQCANDVSQIPNLEDRNTFADYVPLDNFSESFDRVNGWWIQGRVYLTASTKYVGIVDHATTHYVEPVDGTTPIFGGHAFTWDWGILVTVDQYQGLMVQSPFGNYSQNVPYIESDLAYVRITVDDFMIHYWLDANMVHSQFAIGLAARDLRALYIGTVDSALIGHTTYSPQTWHFVTCGVSQCLVYDPCY